MADALPKQTSSHRSPRHSFLETVILLIAGSVLVVGIGLSFYFVADYHPQSTTDAEVSKLQHQIDGLQKTIEEMAAKTPPSMLSAQELKERDDIVAQISAARALLEDRIKDSDQLLGEVRETEQRTRGAAALFLAVFGAIATIVLGKGYLEVKGFKEKYDDWEENAKRAIDRIREVEPQVEHVRATYLRLNNTLPHYIAKLDDLLAQTSSLNDEKLVLMQELDHWSYLTSEIRFRDHSPEQSSEYLRSLLQAARGKLTLGKYVECEHRLHEFFDTLKKHPGCITKAEESRAHSYRALVSHLRYQGLLAQPTWIQELRKQEISNLRSLAFAAVRKAHECDPDGWHGYFVEAMLYSQDYVLPEIVDVAKRTKMFLDGQKKAAELYTNLTAAGLGHMGAWQNLACCLKRIAESTGDPHDYEKFTTSLNNFPTDEDIVSRLADGDSGLEPEDRNLWQSMLEDKVLFDNVVKVSQTEYLKFWKELLPRKMRLTDWKRIVGEIRTRNLNAPKLLLELEAK
jgi:archaellum component FlaC